MTTLCREQMFFKRQIYFAVKKFTDRPTVMLYVLKRNRYCDSDVYDAHSIYNIIIFSIIKE